MNDRCSVEIPEQRRIQPLDPLAFDFACRRAEGRVLTPWDADARSRWFTDCGVLLAKVPDLHQRVRWACLLAEDFSVIGTPKNFVMGLLLNHAKQVRR